MNTPALLVTTSIDQDGDGILESIISETYSTDNLLLKSILDANADGQVDVATDYRYDDNGNQTGQFYDFGNDGTVDYVFTTDFTTSASGNLLITVTSRDLNTSLEDIYVSTYDPSGNLIEESLVTESGATQVTATYSYNDLGQITAYENKNDGTRTEYAYDSAGRFTSSVFFQSDGTLFYTDSYAYDTAGNLTQYERDSLSLSSQFSSTYTYDEENRLVGSIISSFGGRFGSSFGFSYNELGQVTSYTLVSGGTGPRTELNFTYEYDSAGNFISETFNVDGGSPNRFTQYGYDELGRVTSVDIDGTFVTTGTNRAITYEYDDLLTSGINLAGAIESELIDSTVLSSQSSSYGQTSGASTSFLDSSLGVVGSLENSSVVSGEELSYQSSIL